MPDRWRADQSEHVSQHRLDESRRKEGPISDPGSPALSMKVGRIQGITWPISANCVVFVESVLLSLDLLAAPVGRRLHQAALDDPAVEVMAAAESPSPQLPSDQTPESPSLEAQRARKSRKTERFEQVHERHRQGHSARRIARELGMATNTVPRYLRCKAPRLLHHQGSCRSSGFVGPRIASPTSRGESIRFEPAATNWRRRAA